MNNQFTFIGNLAADATFKQLTKTSILNFRLAVSDGYGEKKFTDYHTCKAFGKSAEYNADLKKGDRVLCYGRVKSGSYEKDGKKIYTTEFVADRIYRIAKVAVDLAPVSPGPEFNTEMPFSDEDVPF